MSKPDKQILETGRALILRGGPYTPGEFQLIANASATMNGTPPRDAVERRIQDLTLRMQVVGTTPTPRPPTEFDAKIETARLALESATMARHVAERDMFTAQDEAHKAEGIVWTTDGHFSQIRQAATAEQLNAARERYAQALETWKSARDAEQRAMVRLNSLERKRTLRWAELRTEYHNVRG